MCAVRQKLDSMEPKKRSKEAHKWRMNVDPEYAAAKTRHNVMDKLRHQSSRLKKSIDEAQALCRKDVTKLSAFKTLKIATKLSPEKQSVTAVAVVRPQAKAAPLPRVQPNAVATARPVGGSASAEGGSAFHDNPQGGEKCTQLDSQAEAVALENATEAAQVAAAPRETESQAAEVAEVALEDTSERAQPAGRVTFASPLVPQVTACFLSVSRCSTKAIYSMTELCK